MKPLKQKILKIWPLFLLISEQNWNLLVLVHPERVNITVYVALSVSLKVQFEKVNKSTSHHFWLVMDCVCALMQNVLVQPLLYEQIV